MSSEVEKVLDRHGATAFAFVLYQVASDGTRVLCDVWKAPFENKAELLEQIEERALRQANVLGGVNTFWVEARDGAERPMGSEIFRVTAEALPGGASIATEPSNEGGAFAQMMRHNEALLRATTLGFDKVLGHALKQLDVQGKRADAMEQRHLSSLEILSKVISGERETQLQLAREEASSKMKEKILTRALGVLPEALAGFMGRKPEGAAAAAAMSAKGIFSTLTLEQMQHIMGCLNIEQQAALMGLMKRLAAEEEKQEGGGSSLARSGNEPTH